MRWLGEIWQKALDALLGRERAPRSQDDLYRRLGEAGHELGSIEKRNEAPLAGDPPGVAIADGLVQARVANLSQRVARGLNRVGARARRHSRVAAQEEAAAAEHRSHRPSLSPDRMAAVDFFASRVWTYLVAYGLVVLILEATGMLSSLVSYEAVLGGLRLPMSLAAGAILVAAGHGAGHLLHSALGSEGRIRTGYLSGALVVLLIGAVTIAWLGAGRDANTKAADRFTTAGALHGEALALDERAEELLRPVPQSAATEMPRPSARDRRVATGLERAAKGKRRQATRLQAEARQERTLDFFAPVQILGIAVGAVGGFLFAAAAPTRRHRRLSALARRCDKRAVRRRGRQDRAEAKEADIVATIVRLGDEEGGWRKVALGHHDDRRLRARESDAPAVRGPAPLDVDELIDRSVRRRTNGSDRHQGEE